MKESKELKELKELKDVMKYLIAASNNSPYPLYAQYLHSEDGFVYTCSGTAFSKAKVNLPFKGDVNIFVLDEILKNVNYDCDIKVNDNNLIISKNNYVSKLIIDQIEFPSIKDKDVHTVEITEDLLKTLKRAGKFTSSGIAQYVYMCNNFVCSYSRDYAFFKKMSLDVKEPIGIAKNIIPMLNVGDRIGTYESNVLVYFKNGYIMFTSSMIEEYPSDWIEEEFTKKTNVDLQYLISMETFNKISTALKPIFFGEKKAFIELHNKNKELVGTAESHVNGRSTFTVKTELEEEFTFFVNLHYMSLIPIAYNIQIETGKEKLDDIILSDDKSYVLMKGGS